MAILKIIFEMFKYQITIINSVQFASVFSFQLKKCVQSMKDLSEKYKQLLTSSFDADPESLLNIDMYP